MDWTKERIRELLERNNRAVERAILVLYSRQTLDEQQAEDTKHHNNRGFSGAHAKLGSYYAKWIAAGKTLNPKHMEKARKIVLKYTGQLLEEANERK